MQIILAFFEHHQCVLKPSNTLLTDSELSGKFLRLAVWQEVPRAAA
jgi:hypothetical protein